jgi:hypothetical protein
MLLVIRLVQLAGNETVPVPISTIFVVPVIAPDVIVEEVNDSVFIVPPSKTTLELVFVKTTEPKVIELPVLSVKEVLDATVNVVAVKVQPEVKLKVPVPEKVHAPAVIVNAPAKLFVPAGILKVPLQFKLEANVSVIADGIVILFHTTVLVFIVHDISDSVDPVVTTVPAM